MNDLDLYSNGGKVVPSPGGGELQPLSPNAEDRWGEVPTDYVAERQVSQPADQQQQVHTEIAALISSDLMRLGHPQALIGAAVAWYQNNANKQHTNVRAAHNYRLYSHQQDGMANSFANAMARAGASQEFVNNCLYLLEQLAARVQKNTSHGSPAQGRAPQTSDPLDQLTDAQYQQVVQANETAKANTLGYLRDLWGRAFHANLNMVAEYFNKLPAKDQAHLNRYTTGWIAGTNTKEVMLGLYNMAIGANSLPTNGAAIAQEIAQHEQVMRTDRKRWNSDEQLQARYRTLLDLRDR